VKRVLFIGNSHLRSILDAAHLLSGSTVEPIAMEDMWRIGVRAFGLRLDEPAPIQAWFLLLGAAAPPVVRFGAGYGVAVRTRYREAFDEAVAQLGGAPDGIVSCFGGNEHSIFSLIEHPVPFDVLVDASDRGTASATPRQIVPVDVVRRELRDRVRPSALHCRLLQARFPDCEVVHVMPPPPIEDDEHIRREPEVYVQVIQMYGLAPAPLRRKVYRLYAGVVHDELAPLGVRVLAPPAAAMDDGYLAPDYWMQATHANDRYGRLVLEQLATV
jgi:hypothetical protein